MSARVLVLDNYDSFTFNLVHRLGELGAEPLVRRNDEVDLEGVRALAPSRVVISPGPGRPDDPAYFGVCLEVIRTLGPQLPVLGVCLGMQGIVHAFGGAVVRAATPMHGKASEVHHRGGALFAGLPSPFLAMRYHSLVAAPDAMPGCLRVTAWTAAGEVMAVEHRSHPVVGVQFHPESIGTPEGSRILARFLALPGPGGGR
jgi:anthranilate synthase component 2